MSTKRHRLIIQGHHREWAISQFGDNWIVTAQPTPALSSEFYANPTMFDNLTDAYDAYVAAEYADDGTNAESDGTRDERSDSRDNGEHAE